MGQTEAIPDGGKNPLGALRKEGGLRISLEAG